MIRSRRNFDLLVFDGAFPECVMGLAHHYGAPYMYINTVGFYIGSLSLSGNPAPYSFTPFLGKLHNHDFIFDQLIRNCDDLRFDS